MMLSQFVSMWVKMMTGKQLRPAPLRQVLLPAMLLMPVKNTVRNMYGLQ